MPRKQSEDPLMVDNGLSAICCCGGSSRKTSKSDVFENGNGIPHPKCVFTRVVMVLCVFCVTISIVVAILVTIVFVKFHHFSPMETEFAFCVPCDSLLWREAGHVKYVTKRRKMQNGKVLETCCGKDVSTLDSRVDQLIKSNVEKELAEQRRFKLIANTTLRPAIAAHLVMRQKQHTNKGQDGLYQVEGWDHNTYQPSVVRRHIKYRHGGLGVNKTGLFYIYSQVHFFQQYPHKFSNDNSRAISHYIYKFSRNLPNGGERRLLQNSVSRCSDDDIFSHTSYIGGVFNLDAGDLVYVKVNNWTSVHPNPAVTYFGLLMLDSHHVPKS